jgi:ABC-type transport system substrate-binding protein
MTRTPLLRLAAVFSLALLAACAQKLPIDEGRLVIALPGTPVSLDPRLATDAYGEQILQMTHAALLRLSAAGDPVPDLAVRLGDARPADVRLHAAARGPIPRRAAARFGGREVHVRLGARPGQPVAPPGDIPVRAVDRDARRADRRLPPLGAVRPFLSTMARGIVPAGSRAGGYTPPAGAGPYRIDDVSPDGAAELSAFDGCLDGPPAIRRVTVKFLPDSNVRFLELRTGSVNFALNGVDPDMLAAAGKTGRLAVEEAAGGNVSYLGFNLRDRALSDPRVRRAIALSIDRDAIVRTIWEERADVVETILPAGSWARDPGLPKVLPDPFRRGASSTRPGTATRTATAPSPASG